MHCSCDTPLIQTNYTNVCPSCGVEKRTFDLFLPGYGQTHGRLRSSTTYSRRYRFHSLLLKSVCFHSGPHCDDFVWKFLEERKPYANSGEIQKTLAKTTQKNKRYDMLPIFTKVFCKGLITKNANSRQIRTAMRLFEALECRWKQSRMKRFFSYFYLLEQILRKVGAGFCLEHCKALICKKRRAFYQEMLQKLGGLSFKQHVSVSQLVDLRKFLHRQKCVVQPVVIHPHYSCPASKSSKLVPAVSTPFLRALDHGRMSSSNRSSDDPRHEALLKRAAQILARHVSHRGR